LHALAACRHITQLNLPHVHTVRRAGAKSAPGTSGGAESPGNLGKVLVTASECERFTIAPHTITFAGGSSASSSAAPGVGVKKAQTKFGIHTAAPKPIGYAAPHSEMRDFDFRTIRELPQLVFEYRDEVALCIAGILKSVPGAQLSGAKRSAAAAGLRADVKPNIKPDLASLKAQAAAARAARTGAGSLQGGDEDDDDEEEEDDDSDEEGCSGGRGGRAAGGAARRGGAAASQSVAVVSLLHDEEASAGKGGRRKRGKGGTAAAAAAAAALPTFEETRIVRVVAAGGVSKGIREVLIPVLPAGTGLGYSEGADGALCLDDDDDAGAAAGAGAGRSRSRNAKAGKAAAAGDAGAVCPMPWYGLPHLLAAAQAALASEDSHSSRLRALDAAKALAEASLRGPASSSSSSSSSSAGVSAGGPAGRVWTHSGAVVTSIAQALSQGSGLPLVVAFGPSPAFKPMQDIHIAV